MSASERDWQMFHQRMRDVDTAPLKDRNEAATEWLKAMRYTPEIIAERIGWLFNGSYGHAEYDRAWSILNAGKRANRVAQLAQLIAALEWQVPARMAAAQWNKLDAREQVKVNDLILAELREWERNPEYAHMRKNPARRTVVDPITRRRVRVKPIRQQAGGGFTKRVDDYDAGVPWEIILNGKVIDRVFYRPSMTADEIRHSLIAHDHYDSAIRLRKGRSMKKNPSRRGMKKHLLSDIRHSARSIAEDARALARNPARRPQSINDTEIHTWFERDRQNVELRDKRTGKTLVEWWDEDVTQAVEDGFLDPRDYHQSAWEYYRDVLAPQDRRGSKMKRNPHKRSSKKKLSPKQAAWRKEFARRVKAGMFRKNPKPRKHRAVYRSPGGVVTHVETRGSRNLKRAHGAAIRLQPGSKRIRKNPAHVMRLCIVQNGTKFYYVKHDPFNRVDKFDTVRAKAAKFTNEAAARGTAVSIGERIKRKVYLES